MTGLMGEATAATLFLVFSPWPISWVYKNKLVVTGVQGDNSSGWGAVCGHMRKDMMGKPSIVNSVSSMSDVVSVTA